MSSYPIVLAEELLAILLLADTSSLFDSAPVPGYEGWRELID